jgi:hypothetical protein
MTRVLRNKTETEQQLSLETDSDEAPSKDNQSEIE